MMASKARMFGDDSTLSAILATDDPREHKRLGRQVRHFDHDSWLHERENIALRGNMTNFSQNEDLCLTLLHTGQRRLAEASPYDNLWGIGLKASDYHDFSPCTWRGSNPLGQTLEYVQETLCEITPQISDFPPADNARPLNQPSDTVFEIDPTTQTRLNTAPITEYPHDAALSAFLDSAPDDHTPEILLTTCISSTAARALGGPGTARQTARRYRCAESLSPLMLSSPAPNVAPNTSEQPSTELLHRLDDDQRGSFLQLWSTVPSSIWQTDFALDAPGWDPSAIDTLSATLKEYADIFSSSKQDCDACSLRPFEIKVLPGTHPI